MATSKLFLYILSIGSLLAQGYSALYGTNLSMSKNVKNVKNVPYLHTDLVVVGQRLVLINVVASFIAVGMVTVLYYYNPGSSGSIYLIALSTLSFLLFALSGWRHFLLSEIKSNPFALKHLILPSDMEMQVNGWVMIFSGLLGMITAFAAWSLKCQDQDHNSLYEP